jgi:hypothetical protein
VTALFGRVDYSLLVGAGRFVGHGPEVSASYSSAPLSLGWTVQQTPVWEFNSGVGSIAVGAGGPLNASGFDTWVPNLRDAAKARALQGRGIMAAVGVNESYTFAVSPPTAPQMPQMHGSCTYSCAAMMFMGQ